MASRDLDRLRQALLLVLSTPAKPGATHRLRLDTIFETRISEIVVLFNYMEQAYEKGRQLGMGDIDAKSLGIGKQFSEALRDSFDFTGRKPLPGIVYSAILASVAAGYSSVTGKDIIVEAGRLARIVPYSSDVEDAVGLLEGLESIGLSDYILHLDKAGITKRSIRLNSLSVGDIAERLFDIDTGFAFNVRHFSILKHACSEVSRSVNLLEASIRAFYIMGLERGVFGKIAHDKILEYFIKLDKKDYKNSYDNDKLLGGAYLTVALVHLRKPLPLP